MGRQCLRFKKSCPRSERSCPRFEQSLPHSAQGQSRLQRSYRGCPQGPCINHNAKLKAKVRRGVPLPTQDSDAEASCHPLKNRTANPKKNEQPLPICHSRSFLPAYFLDYLLGVFYGKKFGLALPRLHACDDARERIKMLDFLRQLWREPGRCQTRKKAVNSDQNGAPVFLSSPRHDSIEPP